MVCGIQSKAPKIRIPPECNPAGELDMGIVQSDWQHHVYHGTDRFSDQRHKDWRTMCSVHPESLTVLAQRDAGIRQFQDLQGQRIKIGNPGSGQHGNRDMLMPLYSGNRDDFRRATKLKSAEQAQALYDNQVGTIVFIVGQPKDAIKEVTTACDAALVSVRRRSGYLNNHPAC